MRKVKISALGCYTPPGVLTNRDLEELVQTSHDWIVDRTGIEQRHIAADDVATSDLAVEAGLLELGLQQGPFLFEVRHSRVIRWLLEFVGLVLWIHTSVQADADREMAERLAGILQHGQIPARPSALLDEPHRGWLAWHRQLPHAAAPPHVGPFAVNPPVKTP